jgi:hypothetical protein
MRSPWDRLRLERPGSYVIYVSYYSADEAADFGLAPRVGSALAPFFTIEVTE